MSLDLIEVGKLKLTPRDKAWLTAQRRLTHRDEIAIARDIIHAHIQQQVEAMRIADHLLRSEGLPGITEEGRG